MALTASFSSILNEYAPDALLMEEAKERMWLMQNVEHDENWVGGSLVVTFVGAQASSAEFGSLASTSDIAEDTFVKGTVSSFAELTYSMIFNHKDLMQHNKLSTQNLVKLLPDRIEAGAEYFSDVASLNMTNGARCCKITASASASSGIFTVENIERLTIGQKLSLVDDDTSAVSVYVITINKDDSLVTVSATRGGAAYNASAYTAGANARLNWVGAASSGCSSLRSTLLSSTNGGGSALYGVTKTTYPYLQAQNVSGASMTAANILDKIFDAYVVTRQRGRGNPNKVLMSHTRLGAVMKALESAKGAYHLDQKSSKVSVYGWDSIRVVGPIGGLELVGLREVDNDVMFILDTRPSVMTIHSNGGIQKRKSPEGSHFFEVRNTTGYQYVCDWIFQFEFILKKPSACGVIHSISF